LIFIYWRNGRRTKFGQPARSPPPPHGPQLRYMLQGLDWQCVRCFATTGEASSPEDSLWLMAQAGYKPVIEVCHSQLTVLISRTT